MIRFLLWRLLGLLAVLSGGVLAAWCLGGGPGRALRGHSGHVTPGHLLREGASAASELLGAIISPASTVLALAALLLLTALLARALARGRRRYVRLCIEPYRTDKAAAEAVVQMFEALHKRLLRRWWRRLLSGQPAISLEIHHRVDRSGRGGPPAYAWMALCCPLGCERMLEAALRTAYPNCRLTTTTAPLPPTSSLLRLKKDGEFIRRVKSLDHFEHEREPPVNRLLTVMGASGANALVQVAIAPAPVVFERFARRLFKAREHSLSRERRAHLVALDRSMVEDAELRGGLDVQHRPLFFVDVRVISAERLTCEQIASELRAESAENRLVERGMTIRHGLLSLYRRRIDSGQGNPVAALRRGVFASTELASIWHLPSIDYTTVPFARGALPLAPAPPSILRPQGDGTLRDALGPVSIPIEMRKQNTAVPGAVEQGKSSYLIATVAEDLKREQCAVIVLDPKGDAADAAVSLVAPERTCTLLDFALPTCGFNPLAVDAPADVIADYVVAALKNLYTDADIRASSDRYLRNAIIAVLAFDRSSTLWDAARLLSVGEEGYAYRRAVGSRVRTLPAYKEISTFFTSELTAQLADSRSMTTSKLDAPVNKLARLLNSASIKRVLLNGSLTVDFDRVIAQREVLVVKGALGAMGAGNTSVLMQLLIGMLDSALARQQDMVAEAQRVAVALKVDEAPLVLNRGFAETMALKRSAGLETVACWQTDAQWVDREIREQLDALFAHRVYFATASTREARDAVGLAMPEFSDTVRPGIGHLSSLSHPDVRLHLPKHRAIASWTTAAGRQAPFLASTLPLRVDRRRMALHARLQRERGGLHLADLRQPHWQSDHGADGPANSSARHDGPPAPDSSFAGSASQASHPPLSPASPTADQGARPLPDVVCESFRELVELDLAQSVRWAKRAENAVSLSPEPLDLTILELVARFRHVLSSQLHRHLNPGRAVTTTQRRLKRLSDAGLVERFQFHRRDGGGVPMCYVIAQPGLELLLASGRFSRSSPVDELDGSGERRPPRPSDERQLRQARNDVHVAGWLLALLAGADIRRFTLRGPDDSALSPPTRQTPAGRVALGPPDLRLPGGRVPHEFLRTDATGAALEIERFETLRPHAIVELKPSRDEPAGERAGEAEPRAIDLLIECDDRLRTQRGTAKLQRYDHFLCGWSAHTRRYGQRCEAEPMVVFVCRDRSRARRCAEHADAVLLACRAYAGEYPFDWQYPGRQKILFVAERDMHEHLRRGLSSPLLPPAARVLAAGGDPTAGQVSVRAREVPCSGGQQAARQVS
ncbi:MAG TPA: replication-relaxation family protein [Solirubrobacteraceae bacterium]|nr:replication-relaxation family protein [Solirubrobacteraceae bacterium]